MRFLLTNDDGIDGEGMHLLADMLQKKHEVWIVAPDKNRSAVSHGITMTVPLRLSRRGERCFTCSGVPVDCVINGLKAVLPSAPDAVISGINRGANIGTDVLYSGTCAAARQAALYGIPGIAFSIESEDGVWRYGALADFARKNIEKLVSLCEPDVFLNINALSADSYAGYQMTRLSRREYGDSVRLYHAPDGHSYSFFEGGQIATAGGSGFDFDAVRDGYISVSRVRAQPADAGFGAAADPDFLL